MKRFILGSLAFAAVGIVSLITGCAHTRTVSPLTIAQSAPPRTFALAVTVAGGGEPTQAQWEGIKHSFESALAAYNGILIDDYTRADAIIRVQFTPGASEEDLGQATVLGIRRNSGNTFAGLSPRTFSSGYNSISAA